MWRTGLFTLGLLSALWSANAWSQTEDRRFDGHWGVVLACPPSPDGGLPFTYRFAAQVRGGVLHGQNGTPGQPASLALDGHIQSDGSAQMIARGVTGQSADTVNQTARGVPYQYDVSAQFDAAH